MSFLLSTPLDMHMLHLSLGGFRNAGCALMTESPGEGCMHGAICRAKLA